MALTDHRLYPPSIQAADAFSKVPVDLRIFPGEEIHPPGNPIHIVSFGAKSGITELYRDPENEKKYREEVAKIQAGLKNLGDRRHNLEIPRNTFHLLWKNFEVVAPVPQIIFSGSPGR
jgi:hypothetical protein